jgi:hypothetical protein
MSRDNRLTAAPRARNNLERSESFKGIDTPTGRLLSVADKRGHGRESRGAAAGAATGALVGSFLGPAGALVGGGVGGLIGYALGGRT